MAFLVAILPRLVAGGDEPDVGRDLTAVRETREVAHLRQEYHRDVDAHPFEFRHQRLDLRAISRRLRELRDVAVEYAHFLFEHLYLAKVRGS